MFLSIFKRRGFLFLCLIMFLTACAGPGARVEAGVSRLAAVRTIILVRAPEPEYKILNLNNGAAVFGAVGALATSVDADAKQQQLNTKYKKLGTEVFKALNDRLAVRLRALGYDVRIEEIAWTQANGKYGPQLDRLPSEADAVLIVAPAVVGFVAAGSSTRDYQPTVSTRTTLLGKDRQEVLFLGFHSSGYRPRGDQWRSTPPARTFVNFDALTAGKEGSDALEDGARSTADLIAADLRR